MFLCLLFSCFVTPQCVSAAVQCIGSAQDTQHFFNRFLFRSFRHFNYTVLCVNGDCMALVEVVRSGIYACALRWLEINEHISYRVSIEIETTTSMDLHFQTNLRKSMSI